MKAVLPENQRLEPYKDRRAKVVVKTEYDLPKPPKWLRRDNTPAQKYKSEYHIFLELLKAIRGNKGVASITSCSDVEIITTLAIQIAQYRNLHALYSSNMPFDEQIRYTRAVNGLIKEIRLGLQKLALSPDDRRKLFIVDDKPAVNIAEQIFAALDNDKSDTNEQAI